jgi:iron complex transport system ATP-binding protein
MERLSLRGVSFAYGSREVLGGLDLTIEAGARTAIIGPNGAGKSTLLRLMAGALPPDAGTIRLDGLELGRLRGRDRARRLAFVPQETRIVFDFTALEVVLMGRAPRLGLLGIEGRHDIEVALGALAATDARTLADRPVSQLSSGERQRVLLARALAQEPDTILLDEPTAYLDLGHQARVHALLEKENRERGTTIVFVSHDLNLAAAHATRIVLLSAGRIAADGPPRSVITPDRLRAAYGVDTVVIADPTGGSPIVRVTGPATGPSPGA